MMKGYVCPTYSIIASIIFILRNKYEKKELADLTTFNYK